MLKVNEQQKKLATSSHSEFAHKALILALPPVIFFALAFSHGSEFNFDLRWGLAIQSVFIVVAFAFAEEVGYRRILLGCWIGSQLNINIGVLIQAIVFAFMHGRFAVVSNDHLALYVLAGVVFGLLYVRWRSIWFNTSVHAMLNICIAQVDPVKDWYVGQLLPHSGFYWRDTLAACFLVLAFILLFANGLHKNQPLDR